MRSWTSTKDLRVAAALGSLGVVVDIDASVDARKGRSQTLFRLGLKSVDGRHDTKRLIGWTKSGAMQANEPGHEFLTNLRAMANRECLLDLQKKGMFMDLVQVPGTEIWQYVKGNSGLPGMAWHKEVIETTDLKVVAAAGLVGARLLAMKGGGRDHVYYLPRRGPVRLDGLPPVDVLALRNWWRERRDVVENPACVFTQGIYGLWARERLLAAVNGGVQSIVLTKDRTLKRAVIREDATDKALDKVREFFEG